MGDIIVKQMAPTSLTYHIKNLGELDLNLDMPAFVYAIPTQPDTGAIGLKIEGNTSIINVTWTLVDEVATVVEELTDDDAVKTADEQMVFLLGGDYLNNENTTGTRTSGTTETNGVESFQPTNVDSKYIIEFLPPTGTIPYFSREGLINKLQITKSGNTPVTYNATITFLVASMEPDPQ